MRNEHLKIQCLIRDFQKADALSSAQKLELVLDAVQLLMHSRFETLQGHEQEYLISKERENGGEITDLAEVPVEEEVSGLRAYFRKLMS